MAIFEFCWYICDDLAFLTLSAEPWYGTVFKNRQSILGTDIG